MYSAYTSAISGFPNGNNLMAKPSKIQQNRQEERVGERRGGIEGRWKEMRGGNCKRGGEGDGKR